MHRSCRRAAAADRATDVTPPAGVAAPTTRPATPVRPGGPLPSLTGMRWWAALIVFVLHAVVFLPVYPFYGSEQYWTIAEWVPMQTGATGVAFFFVLSGFILYWTRRSGDSPRSFIRRRIAKIYPTHLVAAALLFLIVPIPVGNLTTWLPTVALIQTWWPNWTSLGGFNIPAWSLVSEMLFYLLFPVIVPLIDKIRDRFVPHAIAAVFAVIVVIHTAIYLWADGYTGTENFYGARLPAVLPEVTAEYGYNASPEFLSQSFVGYPEQAYWFSYYFPAARLPEFVIGVLVARLVISGKWRITSIWWPTAALAAAFGATWLVPVNYKTSVLVVLPTAAVIATAAMRDLSGRRGVNATRPMVWLGEVSYAFYLLQYVVMAAALKYVLAGHGFGLAGWLAVSAGCLLATLVAAAAVYHGVDKPITRLTRRASGARGSPPSVRPTSDGPHPAPPSQDRGGEAVQQSEAIQKSEKVQAIEAVQKEEVS